MYEDIWRLLNEHKIKDIYEFLNVDVDELVSVTNLSYSDISSLQKTILEKLNVKVVLGTNYESSFITTGFTSLDHHLQGGIRKGKLIEICGLPCSAKTKLAMCITYKISLITKRNVIYVDTRNKFSGKRIRHILKENEQSDEAYMDRIKVVRVWNMQELISFMYELYHMKELTGSVSLVVIDSLSSLMSQHKGSKSSQNNCLLNLFVNIAHLLGNEHNLSFLVVNLISRWNKLEGENWMEKRSSTMGKYWHFIPYNSIKTQSCNSLNKIRIIVKNNNDADYNAETGFEIDFTL